MASLRVAQILAAVAGDVSAATTLPQRLVDACTGALPVSGAGIALMTDAGPAGTVAVTDPRASLMEDLQFTLGEGPCVDSSLWGRPVLQPDLAATGPGRWPAFSAGALEAGIGAVFALPLRVGGIRLGVLDLYRDHPGELTSRELTEALAHADAATAILLHLQARAGANGTASGLIPAVEDHAAVHQATGIVSVQADVTLTEALGLLRARAFAADRPIVTLSHDVVAGLVHVTKGGGEIDNG
ncbi:GAF domain-containing protein [soil metagenome]